MGAQALLRANLIAAGAAMVAGSRGPVVAAGATGMRTTTADGRPATAPGRAYRRVGLPCNRIDVNAAGGVRARHR